MRRSGESPDTTAAEAVNQSVSQQVNRETGERNDREKRITLAMSEQRDRE